jgi:integrase
VTDALGDNLPTVSLGSHGGRLLTGKFRFEPPPANRHSEPGSELTREATIHARKATGPRPRPVPIHWKLILEAYLTELAAAGYPATTRATRSAHIRRMAHGLGVSPQNVTGVSLVKFFAKQEQWARETRRGYRNTAASFFGWACRNGHLTTNPADALPSIKSSPPSPRPAPDRVYRAALLAAEPRVMVMLRLAAEAGLRRAEVAQVHTSDLAESFDGYLLVVRGKGGKRRTIPITEELADTIALGAAGHTPGAETEGWLFPGDDGGHLSPRWVGKLCAAAMPAGWTMHKLRHRFATRAFRGTRNLRAVQTLMGHASVATTEIYTAVDDAEVRAAMESVGETSRTPARIAKTLGALVATLVLVAGLNCNDMARAVSSLFTDNEAAFVAVLTGQPGFMYRGRTAVELVGYERVACNVADAGGDPVAYLASLPRVHGGVVGATRWWGMIGETSACTPAAAVAT